MAQLTKKGNIMNAYIYQASHWCEDCACVLCKQLIKDGKSPPNRDDESTYDSDDYPKGPYPNGGGESDSSNSCEKCGLPLDNPLTDEGVNYVIRQAIDDVEGFLSTERKARLEEVIEELDQYNLQLPESELKRRCRKQLK